MLVEARLERGLGNECIRVTPGCRRLKPAPDGFAAGSARLRPLLKQMSPCGLMIVGASSGIIVAHESGTEFVKQIESAEQCYHCAAGEPERFGLQTASQRARVATAGRGKRTQLGTVRLDRRTSMILSGRTEFMKFKTEKYLWL